MSRAAPQHMQGQEKQDHEDLHGIDPVAQQVEAARDSRGAYVRTTYAPGDMAWVLDGDKVERRTVGQVRVILTDSPGINGGRVESALPDVAFDNFKPQHRREEEYMMVETGIGSGRLYTLGKHVFGSREEAEAEAFVAGRAKQEGGGA